MSVVFVIGPNASGKTWFINNNSERICPDAKRLNVFDYQTKAREEHRGERTSEFSILRRANEELQNDIASLVEKGENVIVEHTLFKCKRRLPYIDAIRQAADTPINIYVMWPSDERLKKNIKSRTDRISFDRIKDEMENVIELPNSAEGFDQIYIVTDGEIRKNTDAPDEQLCLTARKELEDEEKERRREEEKRAQRKKLIEELCAGKPFWHYCSGCGKKQLLSSREAFDAGWDYPGKPGLYETARDYGFGIMFPRTCPSCTIDKSLYWKMVVQSKDKPAAMTEEMAETLRRIAAEPFSLIDESDDWD